MEMPKIPEDTTPVLWGALSGAIALAIVGFNWGGWVTGGTSEKAAVARAEQATVAALTPVCVEQFRKAADAPATLKTLKGMNSWEQGEYVGKGGWAKMPGSTVPEANGQVVTACVEALNKLVL